MKKSIPFLLAAVVAAAFTAQPALAADKIALVVKSLGNGFFDAAHEGGKAAAKELGDVELIYTGPTAPTAEAQIEVINSLISQKVDALVIFLGQRAQGFARRRLGDTVVQPSAPAAAVTAKRHAVGEAPAEPLERGSRARMMQLGLPAPRTDRGHYLQL